MMNEGKCIHTEFSDLYFYSNLDLKYSKIKFLLFTAFYAGTCMGDKLMFKQKENGWKINCI